MKPAPSSFSDLSVVIFLVKLVCRISPISFSFFLLTICGGAALLSTAPFLFPSGDDSHKLVFYGIALCAGMAASKIGVYFATFLDNKAYKYLSKEMFASAVLGSQRILEGDSAAFLNKNEQAAESASALLNSVFSGILPFFLQVILVTSIASQAIGFPIATLLGVSSLVQCYLSVLFSRKLRTIQKDIIEAEASAYSNASEVFFNIRTLASLRVVDVFLDRYDGKRSIYEALVNNYNLVRLGHNATQIAVISMVLFLSFHIQNYDALSLISINFVILLIALGFQSVGNDFIAFNDSLAKFKSSDAAITLLQGYSADRASTGMAKSPFKMKIEKYSNIGFTLNTPVELHGPSLVVITGASGLGKTTMLEALANIRMNEGWKILINERCLTSFSQSELEKVFSFAYHDADIFIDSLRFNVTLAKDAELRSVARYDYVINLLGLKHLVDIECHPNTLSSGEKLRIGIARALFLEKAIYMFDEPTSSLDSANASTVINTLLTLGKNHLVFCTSHDDQLIEMADVRLHFEEGCISQVSKIPMRLNSPDQFN